MKLLLIILLVTCFVFFISSLSNMIIYSIAEDLDGAVSYFVYSIIFGCISYSIHYNVRSK